MLGLVSALSLQLVVSVVLFLILAAAFSRVGELFKLSVREHHVEHRRGRIPQQLLAEIRDLVVRTSARGTIRAVSRGGRPYVVLSGTFSENLTQRIRNVVGLYPLAKIRAGKKPR